MRDHSIQWEASDRPQIEDTAKPVSGWGGLVAPVHYFPGHADDVDGMALCRMFTRAIVRAETPRYLSSDHDPLFEYHRWNANLRVFDVQEIKTVPYVPLWRPFIRRPMGPIRRESLDHKASWYRLHASLRGAAPGQTCGEAVVSRAGLRDFRWQAHRRDLF